MITRIFSNRTELRKDEQLNNRQITVKREHTVLKIPVFNHGFLPEIKKDGNIPTSRRNIPEDI
jgi:hypothetical protein